MKNTILLFMIFTILISCKKDSNHNPGTTYPPTNEIVLNNNVQIIDSTKLILNADTTLLSQGHYEYTFSGSAPTLNINDILVGETNGGYLRKVTSIIKQKNKIILETTQATLEDAFKTANFSFNTNMDNLKSGNNATGKQFDVSGTSLYNVGGLSIAIDKGIINVDGDWNFGFNYENSKLDTFEISTKNTKFNGQFTINVSASQAITLAENTSNLGRFAKYDIIYIGIFPVVLYTEVELRCVFSASIAATVKRNLQINTSNTTNIGLKYKNSQWVPLFNNSSNSTIVVGDRSGNVNTQINLAIVPYVSFRLYRILGPYASVGLKELIKGNIASPSLDWDFYAGAWIQTIVGARANILGKSYFDYSKEWNTDTLYYQTPYKLGKTSGDNQTGTANQFLNQPLTVRVLDNNGSGESNVPVYFNVVAGDGTVETKSILTDKDGYANTRFKSGSQNVNQTVEAKVRKGDGSLIYGSPVDFQVLTTASTLALTTKSATLITLTSAVTGGNITNDGGSPIIARGVYWRTSNNPTYDNNNKTSDGTGTGTFTSSLSALTPNTNYVVKAYATNSLGTAFGNEISFQTLTNTDSCTFSFDYGAPPTIQMFSWYFLAPTNIYQFGNTTFGNHLVCTYPNGIPVVLAIPEGPVLFKMKKGDSATLRFRWVTFKGSTYCDGPINGFDTTYVTKFFKCK